MFQRIFIKAIVFSCRSLFIFISDEFSPLLCYIPFVVPFVQSLLLFLRCVVRTTNLKLFNYNIESAGIAQREANPRRRDSNIQIKTLK